jgi:hypothetical protein
MQYKSNGNSLVFVTAVNCMDGRVQIPVIEWLKERYSADFVDMITEPGPERLLAEGTERHILDSIKKRIEISVNRHNSKLIAIIGHYDCAGNPVDKEIQLKQILDAVAYLKSWNFKTEVIGLQLDLNWQINKVV